jgi:hypothetical protein
MPHCPGRTPAVFHAREALGRGDLTAVLRLLLFIHTPSGIEKEVVPEIV